MPGIFVAALIAAAMAVAVYGGTLAWLTPRREWPRLLFAAAATLPLSALLYYAVRVPLDALLSGGLEAGGFGRLLGVAFAPFTEEPAKLLPLLLPWFSRWITREMAWRAGLALGLGFGLGEIAAVAALIRAAPGAASSPWPLYAGFIGERYMVCLIHGAFTAAALVIWRGWGKGLVVGIGTAMLLHLFANLPVALAPALIFDQPARAAVLNLWVLLFWSAAAVLLLVLGRTASTGRVDKRGPEP